MIKIIFLTVLTFGGSILLGCNNRAESLKASDVRFSELKPMPQYWHGILPCADCAGIDTLLVLDKSGTWKMMQTYSGRAQPVKFTSNGSWARTADKLVLTESDGNNIYFQVKSDAIEMTDSNGLPVASGRHYSLYPTTEQLIHDYH